MTASPYAVLPTVVEIIALEDAGEGGAGICPHCGAIGRYIYRFRCSDGEVYGAMRGCFAHFPKSKYFQRLAEILKKQQDAQKKERQIASWDRDVMKAIYKYTEGVLTESEVDAVIRNADRAKHAYMVRRGYR